MISWVLFDFGGVVIESPFVAFAKYEDEHDLPVGFLRLVNSTNPNDNAWAMLERNDVTPEQFERALRGRIGEAWSSNPRERIFSVSCTGRSVSR